MTYTAQIQPKSLKQNHRDQDMCRSILKRLERTQEY